MKPWKGLTGRGVQPLTQEQTHIFITLSLHENNDKQIMFLWDDLKSRSLAARIIQDRLTVDLTLAAKAFLACLCDTPGEAVMWAYTMKVFRVKHKLQGPITLGNLAFRDFAHGFPTRDARDEAWDEQKGYNLGLQIDNAIDQPWFWEFETLNDDLKIPAAVVAE